MLVEPTSSQSFFSAVKKLFGDQKTPLTVMAYACSDP